MKRTIRYIFLFMALMVSGLASAETTLQGEGKSTSPYLINNIDAFLEYASIVNTDKKEVYAKLTNDINLGDNQTMIGKDGTSIYFDGDHHTITVNYTTSSDYAALFTDAGQRSCIQNLTVAGTINTSGQYAGGVVGLLHPNNTEINNCISTVTINSSVIGAGYHGGIVGKLSSVTGTTNMNNCGFVGKLLGANTTKCAGLIGYEDYQYCYFNNCYFAPSEVTVSAEGSNTLFYYSSSGNMSFTINNVYYTQTLGTAQGTEIAASSVASGQLCCAINSSEKDGKTVWYQNLNNGKTVDAYPVPYNTHGLVYQDGAACPSTSAYSNNTHTASFDENGIGTCSQAGCTAEVYEPAEVEKDGYRNCYHIKNLGNLIWYANDLYNRETTIEDKVLLEEDIDLGTYQVMIGNVDKEHRVDFYGQNHTITVHYNTTEDYTALFRKNAYNIYNLTVNGTINTSGRYAAGIVACSDKAHLYGCTSNVAITSTYNGAGYHGGLVAHVPTYVVIEDCAFRGKFISENTTHWGGIIGNATSTSASGIKRTLFYPAEVQVPSEGNATFYIATRTYEIEKCYYENALGEVQGTAGDAADMASGKICYDFGSLWYQTLGTDAVPVLDPTHKKVEKFSHNIASQFVYVNDLESYKHALVCDSYTNGIGTCNVCHLQAHEEPTTVDDVYQISQPRDLKNFAELVNMGNTNIKGKLTADIDISGYDNLMIGTSNSKFCGTFDGNGHSVTVEYITNEDYTALFRYVENATISRLTVKGSVTTFAKKAAGIVAWFYHSTMDRCQSSVTIKSTYNGNGENGGIVAESRNVSYINNCLFDGKMSGTNTTGWGGIYGSASSTPMMKGCLVNPATGNENLAESYAFGPLSSQGLTNCYYASDIFTTTQGTKVTADQVKDGDACWLLNGSVYNGTQAWYQTIGTDLQPVLDNTHKTVYSGDDLACLPAEGKLCSNNAHTPDETFNADGETRCTVAACGHLFAYQDPAYDEATSEYVISNKGQMIRFAQMVSNDTPAANARLAADIDLTSHSEMIGTATKPYAGKFNGQNHKVTVSYTTTEDNTALFRYTKGAKIQRLVTLGTINTSACKAAGIVAIADIGTELYLCTSYVTINSSYEGAANHAGLVAYSTYDNNLKVDNCLFLGSFIGAKTTGWSGIVGKQEYGTSAYKATVHISNCLMSAATINVQEGQFVRLTDSDNNKNITNSYYTRTNNMVYSVYATLLTAADVAAGAACYGLNNKKSDGTQLWYQTIGTDSYPVADATHATVYGGDDACPSTATYSNLTHATAHTNGLVRCPHQGCKVYTPDEPSLVDGYYQIANAGNLIWFANSVNEGNTNINGRITDDIDYEDFNVMIGDGIKKYYGEDSDGNGGIFDGQKHSVKLNMTVNNNSYVGLFAKTAKATIKNIRLDGIITTDGTVVGSLVGNDNEGTKLSNVISSVDIVSTSSNSSSCYLGGLIGASTTAQISNCAFVGGFKAASAPTAGGLAGDVISIYVDNSYVYLNRSIPEGGIILYSIGNKHGAYDYSINNTYYNLRSSKAAAGNSFQPTLVTEDDIFDGTLRSKLGNEWGQKLLTDYPIPFGGGTEYHFIDGREYLLSKATNNIDMQYTRTYNGKWQPLYIPFALKYEDWAPDFEVAYINGIREFDNDGDGVIDYKSMDVVKLKSGDLKPNTPYVIRAKKAGKKTLMLSDYNVKAAQSNKLTCGTTTTQYSIVGTYTNVSASDMNGKYAMGNNGTLLIGDGTYGLGAQRWYVAASDRSDEGSYSPSSSSAKMIITVLGEDEETDIQEVTTITHHPTSNTQMYNLSGQRVQQGAKGLLIKNGRKIFIK